MRSDDSISGSELVAWEPQVGPQSVGIQCPAFELMIGGAVGGGKSDFLLGDFIRGEPLGSAWVGVYFRKFFPDMDDIINRSLEIFGPVYGASCYKASIHTWKFPSGAELRFRGLEKDKDVYKHQGQQYSWVGWDELTQWSSPWPYTYMMSRIRSAKGANVRVRAATNPGGPGHLWVKSRFIDDAEPGVPRLIKTKSGDSYYRVFIPSKLEDNRILMKSDPHYADRILEISDPALGKALRDGRWDIVSGAAFTEWDPDVHVVQPYTPLEGQPIWRSMDWGFKTPYCCLWFTTNNDGDVIVFNEIYGRGGGPNVGTEESPEVVRDKIFNYESLHELYVPIGLLDSQCWEEKGQTGLISRELGGGGLGWRRWPKGPNSRLQQTQLVHQFLSVTNGRSRLKICSNCRNLIRTMPILQTEKGHIELVAKDQEDHAFDALRAGLTKHVPDRDTLRKMAYRNRIMSTGYISASELRGGGF